MISAAERTSQPDAAGQKWAVAPTVLIPFPVTVDDDGQWPFSKNCDDNCLPTVAGK